MVKNAFHNFDWILFQNGSWYTICCISIRRGSSERNVSVGIITLKSNLGSVEEEEALTQLQLYLLFPSLLQCMQSLKHGCLQSSKRKYDLLNIDIDDWEENPTTSKDKQMSKIESGLQELNESQSRSDSPDIWYFDPWYTFEDQVLKTTGER